MQTTSAKSNPFFTSFSRSVSGIPVPDMLVPDPAGVPHALCQIAATQLQHYLQHQQDWEHNFGLSTKIDGTVIGKMFGVLVLRNEQREIGYLAAFSGKLAGGNHHARFVPPVYDMLTDNGFLNKGMQELARMSEAIQALNNAGASVATNEEIGVLKYARKQKSIELQHALFANYHFINSVGLSKNINEIFSGAGYKNPPSGAGECAGPKLLQYAFLHQLKPLALAEFWWGRSPKSDQWKHQQFYPCCKEKCAPILAHMLGNTGWQE